MTVNYEITKASPKQSRMQIRYWKDDAEDYWANVVVEDFSETNLQGLVALHGELAQAHWSNTAELPDAVELEVPSGVVQERVYVDAPAFDQDNYAASFEWVADGDRFIQQWTVIELNDEQKAERDALEEQALSQWRDRATITMRQCRLALLSQGLLGEIENAIASMDEPMKSAVSIEWEYGAVVERNSPWVLGMSAALGLDDVALDQLFFAAMEI